MITIKQESELNQHLKPDIVHTISNEYWILVENLTIDYDFKFPLESNILKDFQQDLFLGKLQTITYGLKFKNCTFKKPITIYKTPNDRRNITFSTCTFDERIFIRGSEGIITFSNKCVINHEITAENAVLDNKIRFRECQFVGNVNFRNTTFKELADFWRSVFHKKTIFYKTDFLNIVVFSAVTFKENVLFTYSLIDKLLLLRGAKAKKGFDISLAIINGKLGLFEFNLNDYKDVVFVDDEEIYEKNVSELAIIPIKNKRETFRILKDNLESQKNLSESLRYKAIEKEILRNELKSFKNNSEATSWDRFRKWLNNKLDLINLLLNKLSNDHGSSYGRAFIFTIIVGWIFFYCSLLLTKTYSFIGIHRMSEWEFTEGFKLFIQFFNPIHKLDYIDKTENLTLGFYIFDFLGKAFVGYGIYQFIQAFRKYK